MPVLLQNPELDWHPLGPELLDEDPEAEIPPPGSPDQATHNLPVQLSSFLGRAEELNLGAKLLAATRLLSLTARAGSARRVSHTSSPPTGRGNSLTACGWPS